MNALLLHACLVALAQPLSSSVNQSEVGRASLQLRFDPYETTWESFKEQYGKLYANQEEELKRWSVFVKNIKRIEEHNWQFFIGQSSYYLGINQFTDMTLEQYQQYNRLQKPLSLSSNTNSSELHKERSSRLNWALPPSVDWRAKGYVTPIKDQGDCGSCWAFSATGSMEGQNYRAKQKLVSLSEQQLVDCSNAFGNKGCNGGLVNNAFNYVKSAGGIQSEEGYPYSAKAGTCRFKKSAVVVTISGYKDITSGDESALQTALANEGPISVAIDATQASFMSYAGGVYDEPKCSSDVLNHALLAVGYGTYQGKDYWLVKNSWGTSWGNDGYVMMSRNKKNQCGIATEARYPLI